MLRALIQDEARDAGSHLAIAVFLSGLANASVLFVLHEDTVNPGTPGASLMIMLISACVLYAICLRQCIKIISSVIETALYRYRCRIADKLRRAELQGLEHIGMAEIYTQVTQQTTFISNSAWTLALAVHALALLAFTSLYIGLLSVPAMIVVLVVNIGGGAFYTQRRSKLRSLILEANEKQKSLFDGLHDLLRGAKEVRLRERRGDDLVADVRKLVQSLKDNPTQVSRLSQENAIDRRMMLFLILACIVFVLPQVVGSAHAHVGAQVAAVAFMFGPIGSLLKAFPEYERADLAAARLRSLEQRLDKAITSSPADEVDPWRGSLSELRVEGLCFRHTDAAGRPTFSLGPINLTLRAGEIVFFVGGNGSGKTTLLRLLSTLYSPSAGSIVVDGIAISPQNTRAFREMVAAVFSDFHLFKRLYGMSGLSDEQVMRTLDLLQLGNRAAYKGGAFASLDLSTGQRKRLAMVVALLEDRPLYVFDEWAADQDPELRRFYYEELLPDLKRRGKTVLAISHDDRYFRCADRVITLEYGAVRTIVATSDTASPADTVSPADAVGTQ